MKPIFKEFNCAQCGKLRYINLNGICFDCHNEKTLIKLANQRKAQYNFNIPDQSQSVEI
jgi:hypothetical protein